MFQNDPQYIEFVKNNKYLTVCEKKEFLNTPIDIFYVDVQSNKQIITYINNTSKEPEKLYRLHILFFHFLNYEMTEKLLAEMKEKQYPDDYIYEYIIRNKSRHKTKIDNNVNCSPYIYTFEHLALKTRNYVRNIQYSKYLDVGCGNGYKADLFGSKIGLRKHNVYGTDIEKWGPYQHKGRMPINFKVLKDNKLAFPDNSIDIISFIFVLHHINDSDMHKLLLECERVLKKNGILLIIEHHIMNDYDHLIVDIEHSLNSYLYDKKINEEPKDIETQNSNSSVKSSKDNETQNSNFSVKSSKDDETQNSNSSVKSSKDDEYSRYFNWMSLDYVLSKYNFSWSDGGPINNSVGFDVRFDNPYYSFYRVK